MLTERAQLFVKLLNIKTKLNITEVYIAMKESELLNPKESAKDQKGI